MASTHRYLTFFAISIGCGSSSVHIFGEFARKRISRTAWRSKLVKGIGTYTAKTTRHLWHQQNFGTSAMAFEQRTHRGKCLMPPFPQQYLNPFQADQLRASVANFYFASFSIRFEQRLTKGPHNWSLSEVVHAIVLLSHFHALSSFVFSCGLTQQLAPTSSLKYKTQNSPNVASSPTSGRGFTFRTNSNSNSPPLTEQRQEVSVDALMARMRTLSQKQNECSETELNQRFKSVEMQVTHHKPQINHNFQFSN